MIRSPSFSREVESRTITKSPAAAMSMLVVCRERELRDEEALYGPSVVHKNDEVERTECFDGRINRVKLLRCIVSSVIRHIELSIWAAPEAFQE